MRGLPLFFALALLPASFLTAEPERSETPPSIHATIAGEWIDFERSEHRLLLQVRDPLPGTALDGFWSGRLPPTSAEAKDYEKLEWTGGAFAAAAADRGAGPAVSAAAGALEWEGLPALLRSPLDRSLPRTAGRGAAAFGLDADASPVKPLAGALSAALPGPLGPCGPSASIQALWDETSRATTVAAFGGAARDGSSFRAETLFSAAELPAREADAWFDEDPPLPARGHVLGALGLTASLPGFSFLLDAAASDAESSGRGAYARAAAEFGSLRGRLCLSADATTPRFTPLDGETTGTAYRAAADYLGRRGGGSSVRVRAEGMTEGKPERDGAAKLSASALPRRSGGGVGLASVSAALDTEGECDEAGRDWGAAVAAALRFGRARKGFTIAAEGSARTDGAGGPTEYVAALRAFAPFGSGGGLALGASAEGVRGEPVRYGGYVSLSARAAGGSFSLRVGTDDRATWESLSHPERSASALGPWTASLRWTFSERREARPRGVDEGLEAAGVPERGSVRAVVEGDVDA
jgi:hypothetical protein